MPRFRARRLSRLLALVAGAALPLGCERADNRHDPAAGVPRDALSLVVISIDTLRADHLGCFGYFRDTSPAIDAFARQAVFFENAYAPMATTLPSHATLFTGLYPLEHGVLANVGDGGVPFGARGGIVSLAEEARQAGLATAAFVSATPLKRYSGFDAGFDVYDEPQADEATRDATATTDAALAWLGRASAPFLLFIHYYDPHMPYAPPAPYDTMFAPDAALDACLAERAIPARVEPDLCKGRRPTPTRPSWNLYDGEIRYTDTQVERVLRRLRDGGLWERCVIVLTADHGEGLNQHGWPQHGRVWNEQLHVPLMIRFPAGVAGDLPPRVPALVSLADVAPTVLGRSGARWAPRLAAQATGRDVLAPGWKERPLLAQRSARDCGPEAGADFVLLLPGWRLHRTVDAAPLLFARPTDPHELRDLSAERSALASSLDDIARRLAGLLAARGDELGPVTGAGADVTDEQARQLEALGYAGGSQSAVTADATDAFDAYPTLEDLRSVLTEP